MQQSEWVKAAIGSMAAHIYGCDRIRMRPLLQPSEQVSPQTHTMPLGHAGVLHVPA